MLRPGADQRDLQVMSGEEANSVFGQFFTPPKPDRPEANGHRVMFSPAKERSDDVFLTVMTMSDEHAPNLPVDLVELPEAFVVTLADRVVVLSRTGKLLELTLEVEVGGNGSCQLLLAGLAPGKWSLRDRDGNVRYNARVDAGRNTAFFVVPGGKYTVQPKAIPGATEFQAPPDFVPDL